ncbi:PREDICTED: scale keratin-like [Tinamus guttatus]|uniref:scale keratin-like n=1 Tax=Tinamus guttatus TaxID=94827 RepID=UPI00052F3218|nr:PREDICTED: scale keratin-like [Tinamus guttatus]
MSCSDLYPAATGIAVPQPIADSCNELCVRQCPDSTALIQPPPVVVTFPGPILSSFPQQAVVGSSGAPAFGGSLASGGFLTSGSLYNPGTTLSYGSRASELSGLGSGFCIPSTSRWFF